MVGALVVREPGREASPLMSGFVKLWPTPP